MKKVLISKSMIFKARSSPMTSDIFTFLTQAANAASILLSCLCEQLITLEWPDACGQWEPCKPWKDMGGQRTCRRSARTALLVTGPATSPSNLDMALPSLVPAWWNTPSLLFSVMHWFLMIVFSPVGLKAPPQVCPGVRHWDTGGRRSKRGKKGILIFFLLRCYCVRLPSSSCDCFISTSYLAWGLLSCIGSLTMQRRNSTWAMSWLWIEDFVVLEINYWSGPTYSGHFDVFNRKEEEDQWIFNFTNFMTQKWFRPWLWLNWSGENDRRVWRKEEVPRKRQRASCPMPETPCAETCDGEF